jgi:hypothetical protein
MRAVTQKLLVSPDAYEPIRASELAGLHPELILLVNRLTVL